MGAVFLGYETGGTTFADDEWTWIFQRRGSGLATYLDPHNDHLSLVPVAVYKLLFATVGLRSYAPYRAVAIGAHLLCVALIFVYARPRVGGFFALLAAALILFFGPGSQEFVWAFQMAWLFAIAAGIGALLLLDRCDRKGDVGASILIGVSLASAGPGVAIAAGAVVDVLQRRRWRDMWIVAAPIGAYGLWWLLYQGRVYSSPASAVPGFVFRAAAGVMSSLTGLSGANALTGAGHYVGRGTPLLLLAALALIWRLRRLGRIPPRVITLLVMVLCFWITTGIGRSSLTLGSLVLTATGDESRYLYVGAVLVVLLAIESSRGISPPAWALALAGLLALPILYSNLGSLRDGAQQQRDVGQLARAGLGTIEMTRAIVKPDFAPIGFAFGIVKAGPYLAAAKALGSPAATATQIASFPETARVAADSELVRIHRLALTADGAAIAAATSAPTVDRVQSGVVKSAGGCVSYRPARSTSGLPSEGLQLTVPPPGLLLTADSASATVGIRRFANQFQPIGTLASGVAAVLRISRDLAPQAWHIQIISASRLRVCRLT